MKIIDFQTQEEAQNFYKDYVFDKNAFQFDPELLNKMAPERLSDMEGDMWKMERLDFPIHSIIEGLQNSALNNLFNYRIHKRIIDIVDPGSKTIDSLTRLNVPAGVDIKMRLD